MTSSLPTEIASRRDELSALCRKYAVASLELFGSGATEEWRLTSDLDFIVTFNATSKGGLADRFLGLAEDLEALFGRRVELITPRAIRNPYFQRNVDATRAPVYAE